MVDFTQGKSGHDNGAILLPDNITNRQEHTCLKCSATAEEQYRSKSLRKLVAAVRLFTLVIVLIVYWNKHICKTLQQIVLAINII